MEELERVKNDWIDRFPAKRDFVDRFDSEGDISEVLSAARETSKSRQKQLLKSLEDEEDFLRFVDSEIQSLEKSAESKQRPDLSAMYAQVNKPLKGKQIESVGLNVENVRVLEQKSPEPPGEIEESGYEEINYNASLESPAQNVGAIKKLRGSVKDTIKLFEKSESSSSDETESGATEHYSRVKPLPPKVLPKPSPAARKRRVQENAYEEIELPTSTFSLKAASAKEIESPGNGDTPVGNTGLSDDKAYESLEDISVAKPKLTEEAPVSKPSPEPAKRLSRSQGDNSLPSGDTDNALKQTEDSTLKFSKEEPTFAAASRGQPFKISGRSQFHQIERDSKINIDNVEGDYCSISEISRLAKHVTVLKVNSNELKEEKLEPDESHTPAANQADTGTVIDGTCSNTDVDVNKKTSEDEREGREEKSGVVEEQKSEKTEAISPVDQETEASQSGDPNMKKFFQKTKDDFNFEGSLVPNSPVIGKRFKSLSTSSESDEEFTARGRIPFIKTEHVDIDDDTSKPENHEPSRAKTLRKTRVPDYESWSFQNLLTQVGMSAADPDNLVDTGSEDDTSDTSPYDNVAEAPDTSSHQSDDSGVCDTTTPTDDVISSDSSPRKSYQRSDSTSINFEVERRKVSSVASDALRSSTASTVTVDGGDAVFLQQCDSIDSPGIPSTLREEAEDRSGEDDNISISSIEDQLDKPDDGEEAKHRARQLHMRHLVVKGILVSEKSYLHIIHELVKAKHYLQSVAMQKESAIALEDVTIIFYMLDEIYQKHREFVEELEDKVDHWTDMKEIGDCFKLMVFYFKLYEDYVNNYPKALVKIHKYQEDEAGKLLLEKLFTRRPRTLVKSESTDMMDPFKEETSKLEDLMLKPVQRIQRNTLVLYDLIKHTPDDHPDHVKLTKALKLSEENLKTYNSHASKMLCQKPTDSRHLVKSGFVVEVARDKKATRHLRYIFLFNDVLICTKHKNGSKHKETSFKYLWSFFLASTAVDVRVDRKFSCKESELEEVKMKIGNMKAELREELYKEETLKDKAFSITQRRVARNIEKLKKKIQEQEACLVEALPHLPLNMDGKGQRPHTLLFSTDYERADWREAIETQMHKQQGVNPSSLTVHMMEALINDSKQRPQMNSIGSALLKKDEDMLNGSLNVTIHKLDGLEKVCDTYCCLEMDSYGHFYKKAQTRVCEQTSDPAWDQDFEMELDCSQTLRILCYEKKPETEHDIIIGKCALELSLAWLNSKFNEKRIMMNEVSITISIRHTPASKTLKRTQSKFKSGIFGVKIQNTTKRECKTVPSIVSICAQQVEKRGMDEVGIYRVSGVTSEVQQLKKLFDKNPVAALAQIGEADIHAITGVFKLYFRELPEPLFTDTSYDAFIQTIELSDEEAKEKCMLDLLHSLPDANYYTIVYMIEHLVRVSKCSSQNKMSVNNLATIFGPTLLHPAMRESTASSMEQIARAARDAAIQCEVVVFFLRFVASGKYLRRAATIGSS